MRFPLECWKEISSSLMHLAAPQLPSAKSYFLEYPNMVKTAQHMKYSHKFGAHTQTFFTIDGNYEVSNCTNLNRVSNNKHCKCHRVILSSFGQTNRLTLLLNTFWCSRFGAWTHTQGNLLKKIKPKFQISLFHGSVECGLASFPDIYVRLEEPETLKFIRRFLTEGDMVVISKLFNFITNYFEEVSSACLSLKHAITKQAMITLQEMAVLIAYMVHKWLS